ncbi:MAG: tRNA uracil 4-sulfurtransferase ThiI [Bacillota bacterium]|nr:tRNA uracil 4-sulfurtransferase ThiI [Bacillota bacterium]
MKEILLAKYGEIVLKGLNRSYFESVLIKNVKHALNGIGSFHIYAIQSTLYIIPKNIEDSGPFEENIITKAQSRLKKVFGIATVVTAAETEKDMESIVRTAVSYLNERLSSVKTFKVEAKRSDKHFYLKSPEICRDVGAALLEAFPNLTVDVHNPEIQVVVEIRDKAAYVHAGGVPGAGGMPAGTSGKGVLMLSGGIDSPIAGYLMARRGMALTAVYFSTPPYTSDRATDKVARLAQRVASYAGPFDLVVVPFTDIQMQINAKCPENLFTLVMRRCMIRISQLICEKRGGGAIVTGESLAQVASQTLPAIAATDDAVSLPVFRPLIGLDKEDIITFARKIDTFDISIEPYEDCCALFSPKHPKTNPNLTEVREAEQMVGADAMFEEAILNAKIIRINP